MPQATLWMGQIINVLAVLALYLLAVRLGRAPGRRVAVLWQDFCRRCRCFTPTGEIHLLAGQAILPAAVLIAWNILDTPPLTGAATCPLGRICRIIAHPLPHPDFRCHLHRGLHHSIYGVQNWLIRLNRPRSWACVEQLPFLPWFVRTFAGKYR
jgi:hypothetical protein